jgi:phosphohistidine phosphatase
MLNIFKEVNAMALFLVQHGKSLPKDVDPDKGLSDQGISEVNRIAAVAKDHQVQVDCICHSGKTRARQTADIFASALEPKRGIQEKSGLKPLDDVTVFAKSIKSEENMMLVGHLPFMERLLAHLITENIEKPVFKFQNGGIVCADIDSQTQSWIIKWALMPNIG